MVFVGFDDMLDQWVVDYIFGFEVGEVDVGDVLQDFDYVFEVGVGVVGQVDLGDVVGDYCGGVEVDLGEEYFYLFDGGVLVFVEDDEVVVQCVFVYVGQWCDFDDVVFDQFGYVFEVEYFVECVVEWVQVGVDFL